MTENTKLLTSIDTLKLFYCKRADHSRRIIIPKSTLQHCTLKSRKIEMDFKQFDDSNSDFKSSFDHRTKSTFDVAEAKASRAHPSASDFEQRFEVDQNSNFSTRAKERQVNINSEQESKDVEPTRASWLTNSQNRGFSSRSINFDDEDVQSVYTESNESSDGSSTRILNDNDLALTNKTSSKTDVAMRLEVGSIIEARYKGKSKFYSGKIIRTKFDGSFDILYDDGERELNVPKDFIRMKQIGSQHEMPDKSTKKITPLKTLKSSEDLNNAAKTINRTKSNSSRGTPSKETRSEVDTDNQKTGTGLCSKLKVGDSVEAYYGGKSKLYPGKITRCRFDGSYDILYDDGERELGVARDLIKPKTNDIQIQGTEKEGVGDNKSLTEETKEFKEGDAVEAHYRGKSKLYPGKITRCRFDGSYDILYDDGERELGVARDLIKPKTKSTQFDMQVQGIEKEGVGDNESRTEETMDLKEGDAVEARYRGKSKLYPGKITRCRFDGSYDILYDDGERELGVARDLIKPKKRSDSLEKMSNGNVQRSNGESDNSAGTGGNRLKVGDAVEARYRGKNKLYPGKITRCRFDGSYDILYDDGERELGVSRDLIKPKKRSDSLEKMSNGNVQRSNDESDNSASTGGNRLKVGDAVEARYRGKSKLYPGKITRCRFDGSYDILYDDGERELGVSRDLIKLKKKDDKVLVDEEAQKPKEEDPETNQNRLKVGDAVEARYRGKSKLYPGKITRCRFDGSYDILYDDGERELGVALDLIKTKQAPTNAEKNSRDINKSPDDDINSLKIGDPVQAHYQGKSKLYPGKITRCRSDGSFDILYDDGERELGVVKHLIKPKKESITRQNTSDENENTDNKSPSEGTSLKVGDVVEARYRGKSKLYPGKIIRCRFDGSYDILYDDGERELGVAKELIKPKKTEEVNPENIESAEGANYLKVAQGTNYLKVGGLVEAHYRGKSKLYPGKIIRCQFDGSYDILYDDGETERGVAKELIKPKKSSANPENKVDNEENTGNGHVNETNTLKVGDSIEAYYRGKSKLYPGKIIRSRFDGSYDILYDDGDRELGVVKELIKSKTPSMPENEKGNEVSDTNKPINETIAGLNDFNVGDTVEAQYRGKNKFYAGKIVQKHSNGYDILYDDGDTENGISADLIRAVDEKNTNACEGNSVENGVKGKKKIMQSIHHHLGIIEDAQRKIRAHLEELEQNNFQ